jgi:Flavin containing amine oxidoreductase
VLTRRDILAGSAAAIISGATLRSASGNTEADVVIIGAGQAALLATAVRAKGKRLHFAGEHLAQENSGMEAALESGNRVARMIATLS